MPSISKTQRKMARRSDSQELRAYEAEGHFKTGSMEPKVEAVIRFIENGGKRAIVAKLDSALEALKGETGTQIVSVKEKSSIL